MNTVPIRGFTSGMVHAALDRDWQWLLSFGVECRGSLVPIVALCGVQVGQGHGVVVMQPGTAVRCRHCQRALLR